jgi:hypothetical protein
MSRIIDMIFRLFAGGVKTRCPFCGEDIRVEYSLSVCPHCFGTIRYSKQPTRKIKINEMRKSDRIKV